MSQVLIQQYLNQAQDLRKVSGTHRAIVFREAFKDLLKVWGRSRDLIFVPEYEIATPTKDYARWTAPQFIGRACRSDLACSNLLTLHTHRASICPSRTTDNSYQP